MTILDIKGLNASVENTQILYDFNLQIEPNQIHVIMGPNGCGKSTLSSTDPSWGDGRLGALSAGAAPVSRLLS